MRCKSNVRTCMKSKPWALSLVLPFFLSQPRLTFLKLGEFHARSRLASSIIPEGKRVACEQAIFFPKQRACSRAIK